MQPSTRTAVGQAPVASPGGVPPVGTRPVGRPAPDLEARMAAVKEDMDARLALAAVAYEVNTAHIGTTPVDWSDIAAP